MLWRRFAALSAMGIAGLLAAAAAAQPAPLDADLTPIVSDAPTPDYGAPAPGAYALPPLIDRSAEHQRLLTAETVEFDALLAVLRPFDAELADPASPVRALIVTWEVRQLLNAPGVISMFLPDDQAEALEAAKQQAGPRLREAARAVPLSADTAPLLVAVPHRDPDGTLDIRWRDTRFAALRLLRQRHGDQLWQYPLWRDILDVDFEQMSDRAFRAQAAAFPRAAENMGSPVAAFTAAMEAADLLVPYVFDDPAEEARRDALRSRRLIPAARAFAPHYLALLADVADVAAAEQTDEIRDRFGPFHDFWSVYPAVHDTLAATGEEADLATANAIRAAAPPWFPYTVDDVGDGEVSTLAFEIAAEQIYRDRDVFDQMIRDWSAKAICSEQTSDPVTGAAWPANPFCIARQALLALDSVGRFEVAAEYGRAHARLLESEPDLAPRLGPALVEWLEVEVNLGRLAEARRVLARLDALRAGGGELTRATRAAMHDHRARLADAGLDDRAAVTAADALVFLTISETDLSRFEDPARARLNDLLDSHLRGGFCASCGRLQRDGGREPPAPLSLWLRQLAQELVAVKRAVEAGDREAGFGQDVTRELNLVFRAGPAFRRVDRNAAELWTWADQTRLDFSGSRSIDSDFVAATQAALGAAYTPERLNELIVLKTESDVETVFESERALLAFFLERDLDAKRATAIRAMRDNFFDRYGEKGVYGLFYRQADAAAQTAARLGYPLLAQTLLEGALTVELGEARSLDDAPTDALRAQLRQQAPRFISILAQATAQQARQGDAARARPNLRFALELLDFVRAREWRAANLDAAASISALQPSIALLADAAHRLAEATDAPADHALAFETLQLVTANETALFALAALERRVAGGDAAYQELAEASRARAEIGRLIRLRDGGVLAASQPLEARIAQIRESLSAADAELRAERVRVADAATPSDAGLIPARSALEDGEGLILLHAGEAETLGLLLTADDIRVWRAPLSRAELDRRHRELRAGLSLISGGVPNFPIARAHELHQQLLGPVALELETLPKLVIVADGPLQGLPFAALPTAPPVSDDGQPLRFYGETELSTASAVAWFGQRHAIGYAPSVRALAVGRAADRPSAAAEPYFAVGAPAFSGPPSVLKSGALDTQGDPISVEVIRRLSALPETEAEVRAVSGILGGTDDALLLGADATETRVKATDLSRYRVLGFSTHGFAAGDAGSGVEPGLALTPPTAGSLEDDGYLSLSEILRLRLDAEIVMLSACDTATSDGRPRAGAMSGLARGFLSAGARRVFASLWPIPDLETRELVTRMVATRNLLGAPEWRGALQGAVIAATLEPAGSLARHPAVWGAFVVIGR